MTITCILMLIIKDMCYKPKLHNLVLAGVWPPCCATSSLGAIHVYHEKRVAWVSISISMHACDRVPIVMGLRLAALWAAVSSAVKKNGAACQKCCEVPLMRVTKILFCRYDVKFFSPLWGINSKNTHYFLSLFCQYLEKYYKSSHCGLLRSCYKGKYLVIAVAGSEVGWLADPSDSWHAWKPSVVVY